MSQDDPPPLTSRDALRKLVSTESAASHGAPPPPLSEAGGAVPRPPASTGRHSRGPSYGGASESTALDPAASIMADLEMHQQCSPAEIRSAQHISTSLASRNPTKNLLCQPPTVQSIPYYHQSGVALLTLCVNMVCFSGALHMVRPKVGEPSPSLFVLCIRQSHCRLLDRAAYAFPQSIPCQSMVSGFCPKAGRRRQQRATLLT